MTGSGEADPPHARQIMINKEVASLAPSLRLTLFRALTALSSQACLPHYLSSFLPIKVIVTASGNYNRLNHRSFVEGCDECIMGDMK